MAEVKELEIKQREEKNNIVVISIIGVVDWSNYLHLDRVFESIFTEKRYKIIVDMQETKYISSAGVGTLINAFNTVMEREGKIVFTNISPEIMDVFALLGLNKIFNIAPTVEQALQSF